MSINITTAFVNQFSDNIAQLVQQKGSKLRDKVYNKPFSPGEYFFQEQIGATTAVKNTSRHSDTPLVNSDHYRRRGTIWDYDWADLIDTQDKLRMLVDPASSYAENAADAISRAIDDEIIAALGATAYAGKSGGTSVAFGVDMDGSTALSPAAGGVTLTNMTVASTAGAASDLTVLKLRLAKFALDYYDVPADDRMIVCAPAGIANLLYSTKATSADYAGVKALVNGDINSFLGFRFVVSSRLPIAANIRSAYAFHKTGICLSVAQDIKTDIGPRRDKRNAVQVFLTATFGSVRLEERKVVKIQCDESQAAVDQN